MNLNAIAKAALTFSIILILLMSCTSLNHHADYKSLINQGEFTEARQVINDMLDNDTTLTEAEVYNAQFELERIRRIEIDFNKTREDVREYFRDYYPDLTDKQLDQWETDKSLEMMLIDGQKRYFRNAARNLFRINKEAKGIWEARHPDRVKAPDDSTRSALVFNKHNQAVIDYYHRTGGKYAYPATRRIDYSITVNADAVPAGETIRCWIPYPREIQDRQLNIKYLSSDPAEYQIAPNDITKQRTIYFEKKATAGEPTVFRAQYEYTIYAMYTDIVPENVVPVDPEGGLKPFLSERAPHIMFTDTMRALSTKIVGDETNPYRKAQKIFAWIGENIPWASAREYSTIRNLSEYPIINMHGDCGIKAMLMITLCRLNGIPARWQSGWHFEPAFANYDNMHDWGMIYFEPYGWLPFDPDYGLCESDNEELKWFRLGGMDNGRLIFNDNFSDEFYPKKIHFRSETLDSQRGEVEWAGGNLYFDQWDYDMNYEILSE